MSMRLPVRMMVAAASLSFSAAWAVSLDDLSNRDASSGLKAALDQGAVAAVSKLGVTNGFLDNELVRIKLPKPLEKARPLLAMTGQGQKLDELVLAMNHAAEAAVPMAKPLLLNAVKSMSVADAKGILSGGETSVTDFFRTKTSAQLSVKFLPIVKKVTDRSDLSAKYNSLAGQMGKFGGSSVPASVEDYVTQRALDGLFTMIGEEEKAIRRDPIGTGSKILAKVFGALN